jgi:hypothetical protein
MGNKRKALIVGIDYYEHGKNLKGCVRDAHRIANLLERHGNGTINFDVKLLVGVSESFQISHETLWEQIVKLFKTDGDALFYFSGHGHIENEHGYLMTSECKDGDQGVSMADILELANNSKAKNKIIILDSCYSGGAVTDFQSEDALLSKGTTILTAAAEDQYAMEKNGEGVFTSLLVDALIGSAANLVGEITPGSIYAHIDKALGAWQQRPLFKTNVKDFVSLRKIQPPISHQDLIQITELFEDKNYEFPLDPTYEPTEKIALKENTEKFAILQKYRALNLVVPIGEEHMYFAAINSKSCELTLLGQHYWNLVKNKRI